VALKYSRTQRTLTEKVDFAVKTRKHTLNDTSLQVKKIGALVYSNVILLKLKKKCSTKEILLTKL